jgi:hypothetical protein
VCVDLGASTSRPLALQTLAAAARRVRLMDRRDAFPSPPPPPYRVDADARVVKTLDVRIARTP